ncbi:MAG: ABC transporter permease [Sulfuricurvum sp.]|uniref:ABC transporter permease n=1 Tax=Sulfuricurvum sp. TaxID=2025608 RepID=UPI0025EA86B0|nr:ABC transporter permease [Sulfuricurvum sp.]MCK9373714.1 ABC transporter permease [Sulfuricurvum sp.]
MIRVEMDDLNRSDAKLFVRGDWTKEKLDDANRREENIASVSDVQVTFDFSECTRIDSAGAVEIIRLKNRLIQNRCTLLFVHQNEEDARLLNFYEKNFHAKPDSRRQKTFSIEGIGMRIVERFKGIGEFLTFIGAMVFAVAKIVVSPWKFRFTAFVRHVDTSAIGAIPIIAILSFLIGVVIAYQSAGYLSKIGGDIFIVDLSVMSVFRELSPMITAILIAARSASSFTAQIGTMKITEEIDAMRTMGFDPFIFLVVPRVFALILTMPFLIFIADMAGMLGALGVATFHLGISPNAFMDRMYLEVSVNEFYVGLAKSPIYGGIVAIVGCYRGFQVKGSTDSIGAYTTKSVVSAIFWVIICDACIAIALTKLGI